MPERLARMDKVNELATEIGARGVGHARAQLLGVSLSEGAGVCQPEFWYQGLLRTEGSAERKQVNEAVAECADGDSIAAHYGHGIDLFCTEDFGKSARGASVLDACNRKWLSDTFGIRFVTLAELAAMV